MIFMDESAHFFAGEREPARRTAGGSLSPLRCGRLAAAGAQTTPQGDDSKRPIVLTDSIFSMTGEVAPIDCYAELLADHATATLLVDDAHGIGALGHNGRGTLEHLGLWNEKINSDPSADGIGIFICGTLEQGDWRLWRHPCLCSRGADTARCAPNVALLRRRQPAGVSRRRGHRQSA